jgi:hypothetical protein
VDEPGRAGDAGGHGGNAPGLRTAPRWRSPPVGPPQVDYVPRHVRCAVRRSRRLCFPGGGRPASGAPIRTSPERAVLGWYREGDRSGRLAPQVGGRAWDDILCLRLVLVARMRSSNMRCTTAISKTRYRSLMKFCLLWANHNAPGTLARRFLT